MNTDDSPKQSRFSDVARVLSDHAELAGLEAQFEMAQIRRRVLAIGLGILFGTCAFLLLQVALVLALARAGLAPIMACLLVAGANLVVGASVAIFIGRRDPRAGKPFEATRKEWGETFEWIQKLFS